MFTDTHEHTPTPTGQPLYFIYSCWLGAYYCYDYAWALRGVSLSDRLSFFESSAPFFAGVCVCGFLCDPFCACLPSDPTLLLVCGFCLC